MLMSRAARSCDKHMLNLVNISQVWSQCLSFSMLPSKAWELHLLRSLNEVSYFQWKSLLAILRCSYLNVVWIPAFLGTNSVTCPLFCLFVKCTNCEVYKTSCDVYSRMFLLLCVLFAHCWVLRVLKTCIFLSHRRFIILFKVLPIFSIFWLCVRTKTCWNLICQVLLVNSVFAIMFSNSLSNSLSGHRGFLLNIF